MSLSRSFTLRPAGKGKLVAIAAAALLVVLILVLHFTPGGTSSPWSPSAMPDLAATGDLPRLSIAMEENTLLRDQVKALTEKDEGWIFINYRDVDTEIASILLSWAGADMGSAAKTREGIDSRIDTFLRKIYGFGPDDYIMDDPLVGENPWVRWFNHYKPRLLIQTAAQRVYSKGVLYDPQLDTMAINGNLSPGFIAAFKEFAVQQPDPAPFINNLLAFIDSTKGLKNLADKDRKIVEELMALRSKP